MALRRCRSTPTWSSTPGLGARLLADDRVLPVRGQVVLVEQVGLDRWWLDCAGPTYVVPRAEDIVVGGTDEEGEGADGVAR